MGDITLKKALIDYKTVYMSYRNFAERTRVEYLNDLEDLVKYAQGLSVERVSGLGLAIIHRYVAQLEERGFASLTRKRKVVAIRSFLSFLYQDGYIGTNLAARVVLPFTESTTPHILTRTECDCLRSACAGSPRDAAIFELLLQTGIRLSELTRLTMSDIDFGGKTRTEEGGNGSIRILGRRARKERLILLNSKACGALANYLEARKGVGNNVLFLNRFGEPLGDRGVQKMLRKHVTEARIGNASIHALRHTFAVQRIEAGIHPKILMEIMGDKDARSTSVYTSLARTTR